MLPLTTPRRQALSRLQPGQRTLQTKTASNGLRFFGRCEFTRDTDRVAALSLATLPVVWVLTMGVGQQKKMAELASRRGTDVDGAAAAKKAAFLKEAEEAVRRATLQVRRGVSWTRHVLARVRFPPVFCARRFSAELMTRAGRRKLPGGVQPRTESCSPDRDGRMQRTGGADAGVRCGAGLGAALVPTLRGPRESGLGRRCDAAETEDAASRVQTACHKDTGEGGRRALAAASWMARSAWLSSSHNYAGRGAVRCGGRLRGVEACWRACWRSGSPRPQCRPIAARAPLP